MQYLNGIIDIFKTAKLLLDGQEKNSDISDIEVSYAKNVATLRILIKEIIEHIFSQLKTRTDFIEPKNMRKYPYLHALESSLIAASIAIRVGLKADLIQTMMLATVFCEMSNLNIPPQILYKSGNLSKKELEIIHNHCIINEDFLKPIPDISDLVRRICLEHHERMDGSGYPNGIGEKDIHITSKIVAVADNYDALISDRTYRSFNHPKDAINFLREMSIIHFDNNIVRVLEGMIQPFMVGTIVELSNHSSAVVVSANNVEPMKPQLQLLTSENLIIDLVQEEDLSILGIKYMV